MHAKTLSAQEVRALLTARKQLQTDLEISLRGILRGFGLKVGTIARGGFEGRIRELVAGQAMLERVAEPMLRAQSALRAEFASLHRQLLQLARDNQVRRLLMTAPGAGPVTALTYSSAIDDRRFVQRGAHRGIADLADPAGAIDLPGLVLLGRQAEKSSDVFGHAMLVRTVRLSALKAWALRIAGRHGMKKAKVALARKLAVVLHRMWVDGTSFRWAAAARTGV